MTHPRIHKPPTPVARALEQTEAWLESPSLVVDRDFSRFPGLKVSNPLAG